jgi:hypothetical protein
MPPITIKKKKLTIKPHGASPPADADADADAAADAGGPPTEREGPVLAAPARGGIATTLFAVVALIAVLLFGALAFLQVLELNYYDQPPPVFLKPGMAVASLPAPAAPEPAAEAPAEPEPAAE